MIVESSLHGFPDQSAIVEQILQIMGLVNEAIDGGSAKRKPPAVTCWFLSSDPLSGLMSALDHRTICVRRNSFD